jgi:two-component system, NarL family, sensor histidine kinase UhpB
MNLKRHLLIRISLVGLLCWLGVSIYVVAQAGRRSAQNLSVVADKLQAMVSLDVMQRLLSTGSYAGYPALGWIAEYFPDPLCLHYRTATGTTSDAGCDHSASAAYPHWLLKVLSALGPGHVVLRRDISLWSRVAGSLDVELDEGRLMAREWRSVKEMLGLTAVTLLVLNLLTFWAVGRALRPAAKIVASLERLGVGQEHRPMPAFQPREFGLIADGINRLAARLAQSTAARAELTARLIRLQETERREIAHELHEEFGQCVAALSAVGVGLRDSVMNGETLTAADVLPLEAGVETMLNSLRSLLQRLSSPPLDQQGLRSAITDLAAAWRSRLPGSAQITLEFAGLADDRPHDERAVCVYRIVQECLNNIAHHAPASSRIGIAVRQQSRQLCVRVENDRAAAAESRGASTGMGLKLLEERVRCLGGTFTVDASAAHFAVQAAMPTHP